MYKHTKLKIDVGDHVKVDNKSEMFTVVRVNQKFGSNTPVPIKVLDKNMSLFDFPEDTLTFCGRFQINQKPRFELNDRVNGKGENWTVIKHPIAHIDGFVYCLASDDYECLQYFREEDLTLSSPKSQGFLEEFEKLTSDQKKLVMGMMKVINRSLNRT